MTIRMDSLVCYSAQKVLFVFAEVMTIPSPSQNACHWLSKGGWLNLGLELSDIAVGAHKL